MDKCSEDASKSSKSSNTGLCNNCTENRNSDDDKTSLQSLICRICFDDTKEEPIITPCHCKGTVAYVHRTCLEKWLSESNTTSCELCHHIYETERIPKYTAKQSIWQWIWYQPQNIGFQVRRLRGDLLACAILTPLAILVTYVCLFSADYYNQQKFSNIPVAKWTSISLLIMIALLLFGYYLWVYVVVGYHGRTWYYWWQRECVVRYIPPVNNTCCETPAALEVNTVTEAGDNAVGNVVICVHSQPNMQCVESRSSQSTTDNVATRTPSVDNSAIIIEVPNENSHLSNVDADATGRVLLNVPESSVDPSICSNDNKRNETYV